MIQNRTRIIGLTGGIATGKSTVANMLKEKNHIIIDADKIAREVVEINKPAYNEIVRFFGSEVLEKNGELNRKALGRIIFSDGEKRRLLNSITHPFIFEEIKERIEAYEGRASILFLDIPLLFEEFPKWEANQIFFDEICLVYIGRDLQIERLMKRDGISKEEALRRIESQLAMEDKKKLASRLIDNSGDINELREKIEDLLLDLT